MTKDKFSVLLSAIIPDVICKIMDKYKLKENEALSLFYKSNLYKVLEDEDTKVWHYSSLALVEILDSELKGHIEFPEDIV